MSDSTIDFWSSANHEPWHEVGPPGLTKFALPECAYYWRLFAHSMHNPWMNKGRSPSMAQHFEDESLKLMKRLIDRIGVGRPRGDSRSMHHFRGRSKRRMVVLVLTGILLELYPQLAG